MRRAGQASGEENLVGLVSRRDHGGEVRPEVVMDGAATATGAWAKVHVRA